jgi:hypothetical protein
MAPTCHGARSKRLRPRNIRWSFDQAELCQLLGFETRDELDAFLKTHALFDTYTMADLERERQDLDRLGF